MTTKRPRALIYILSDYLAAALAWTLFYIYRRIVIEPAKYGYSVPINFDDNYYYAIALIPLYWIFLFWLIGSYKKITRKSRVKELGQTLSLTFLGSILLFFILLIDDVVQSYSVYRMTFITLFILQFVLTYSFRLIILTRIKTLLKTRKIGFNTLLVGSNQKAARLYIELENEKYSQGYLFTGYAALKEETNGPLSGKLNKLGTYEDLGTIIKTHKIEDVILAVESSEHHLISDLMGGLESENVNIKVIPDMYDIISGSVKMNYIFGTALLEVSHEMMPAWQKNIKRVIDIVTGLCVLILGLPFYIITSLAVKFSSPGAIFFLQERIGLHGKPFMIIKFRTMYVNAEQGGPQLSSDNDPRITKLGRVLRKYRLDEFPQFWNVVIGEMSLVGPRPERQFFIDQIVKTAPHYNHLLKVRPGITSWGQVKFGYAENVEQMVERMKFDILYVENMSLAMDLKILFYTVLIMLQGRGK